MNLLVIPFIETTIPADLQENKWGVAHHVLRCKGENKSQKTSWSIDLISINGIWHGASSANYNLGGYGSPCTRNWSHPFTNAEDCIAHYHRQICEYLAGNGKKTPMKPSFSEFKESYPYDCYNFV